MTLLVFDIETIPDIDSGRKLYSLDGLSDEDTAKALFALRRNKAGHDFLPHYLQKIVAISLVMANASVVKVWSLGDEASDEKELIERFFNGIDRYTPTLVSWNGSGFDLPVLHYRALHHGICAPTYWETGDNQQNFRWNSLTIIRPPRNFNILFIWRISFSTCRFNLINQILVFRSMTNINSRTYFTQ